MNQLPDPRYTTDYASNYKGTLFHSRTDGKFYVPAAVNEQMCRPGYQPKRPDKGYALTVNDYSFHPIQYGGSQWPTVVHTPLETDN